MFYKADVDLYLWFTLIYTTAYEIYRSVGPLTCSLKKGLQMDENNWAWSLDYFPVWVCLLFDTLAL